MVYNTENGASLQRLLDKSQISRKKYWCWILLLEIVKKESKTLNTFQKLLESISQSPQYNRAGRRARQTARGVEETVMMRELPRNLEMQVAYLNNSSEKTISGSNRMKKQHETIK